MNFQEDIRINEADIPGEWLRQADLKHKFGRLAAVAEQHYLNLKDEVEMAKQDWEAQKRSLAIRIRKEEIDIGCKVTDKAVEDYKESNTDTSCANLRTTYFDKKKEMNQALRDWKTYESASMAFSHKKMALEKLTELYTIGYYADPKTREQQNKPELTREERRRQREELQKQ